MKLTFDDLCAQIVGEDIMSATKLQQPAVQKPGTTTNQAPQPTPAAQQNNPNPVITKQQAAKVFIDLVLNGTTNGR